MERPNVQLSTIYVGRDIDLPGFERHALAAWRLGDGRLVELGEVLDIANMRPAITSTR